MMVAEVRSTLQKLDLSHNDLQGGGASAISEQLQSKTHGLTSLLPGNREGRRREDSRADDGGERRDLGPKPL